MADVVMVVENRGPMPKVTGRGRKKGSGPNLQLLRRLEVGGNPIWDVPKMKMLSLRQSARLAGVRLRVREIPKLDGTGSGLYVIQRVKDKI